MDNNYQTGRHYQTHSTSGLGGLINFENNEHQTADEL